MWKHGKFLENSVYYAIFVINTEDLKLSPTINRGNIHILKKNFRTNWVNFELFIDI